ncbi:E3 Ubiquitin-Protein Ligase Rnf31 [Manis pentadactyla]|nr:E3 Ubiquitin-Protein Ligase Rnf31 [Manis pentadactyla]
MEGLVGGQVEGPGDENGYQLGSPRSVWRSACQFLALCKARTGGGTCPESLQSILQDRKRKWKSQHGKPLQ